MPNIQPIGAQWHDSGGVPINNPGTGQVPLQFTPISTHADPAQFDDMGQALMNSGKESQDMVRDLADREIKARHVSQTLANFADFKSKIADMDNALLTENHPPSYEEKYIAGFNDIAKQKLDSIQDKDIRQMVANDIKLYEGAKIPVAKSLARSMRVKAEKEVMDGLIDHYEMQLATEQNPLDRQFMQRDLESILTDGVRVGYYSQDQADAKFIKLLNGMNKADLERWKQIMSSADGFVKLDAALSTVNNSLDAGNFKYLSAYEREHYKTQFQNLWETKTRSLVAQYEHAERWQKEAVKERHDAYESALFDEMLKGTLTMERVQDFESRNLIDFAAKKRLITELGKEPVMKSDHKTVFDMETGITEIYTGDVDVKTVEQAIRAAFLDDKTLDKPDAIRLVKEAREAEKQGGIFQTREARQAHEYIEDAFKQSEFTFDPKINANRTAAKREWVTRVLDKEKPFDAADKVIEKYMKKSSFNQPITQERRERIAEILKNKPPEMTEDEYDATLREADNMLRQDKKQLPEVSQPGTQSQQPTAGRPLNANREDALAKDSRPTHNAKGERLMYPEDIYPYHDNPANPGQTAPIAPAWDEAGFDAALEKSREAGENLKRTMAEGDKLYADFGENMELKKADSVPPVGDANPGTLAPMGVPELEVFNYRQRAQRAEAVASGNRVTHEVVAGGKKYQVSTLPDELKDPSGELTKLIDAIYVAEGVNRRIPYGRIIDGKKNAPTAEAYNRSLALDHVVFGLSKFVEKFGQKKLKDEQGQYSEEFIDFLWKEIERDAAIKLGSYSPVEPDWSRNVKSAYYGSR